MREFPDKLHVKNKSNFLSFYKDRSLCYLRKDIYEHILIEDENTYFDIDIWCRKNLKNDVTLALEFISQIRTELEALGWKTKLSFGNTGLFIYSSEQVPSSCYDDDL